MRFRDLFLRRRRQPSKRPDPFFASPVTHPGADAPTATLRYPVLPAQTTTSTAPTVVYEPHGIDTPETLAAIVAKAHASVETEPWGEWDQPGTGLAEVPARELAPPPPMPFSGVSRIMVAQITYPDPADLSIDKDRHYRETFRLTGVATGTSGSLEDTGMWALPALEPGDGTGVRL